MSKTQEKSTSMTRFEVGKLALNNMPEYLKEVLGNAAGRDNLDREDVLIPRLGLAQAGMSPQLKKNSELFIPELQAGQLFNTTTNEIYGTSVVLVPLFFFKNYIEFAKGGGGVKKMYMNASEVPPADLQFQEGESPVVTEFKNRFCLLVADGKAPDAIIASFKSSGLKTAKKWNSFIQAANVPSYARSYKLKVIDKKKGQQEWFGLDVEPDVFVPQEFFAYAKSQFDTFVKGGFKVDDKDIENQDSEPEGGNPSF